MVTPYAGVWIEITIAAAVFGRIWSLPTRECGLKFIRNRQQHEPVLVTPYAGVWIEIIYAVGMTYSCVTSLPTRECGLKLQKSLSTLRIFRSLPTRECGLKYYLHTL